jgi:hypothetical protein
MRERLLLLGLPVVALLIAGLAFGIPLAGFGDKQTPLTEEQAIRLTAQARHRLGFPPLKLQVVAATAASDDPDAGRGTVAVRSLFGVRTGTVTLSQSGADEVSRSRWEAALWIAFVVVELAIVVVFIALWQTSGDYYADEDEEAAGDELTGI